MVPKNPTAYQRFMQKVALALPEKTRGVFLHPAGPTTIFFWAPTFKWGLVIAGIGDINRPVDTISVSQTFSLMLTGLIWSRYSVVIIPKNYNLLSVNAFVALANGYNFVRGAVYHMDQDKNVEEKGKGKGKKNGVTSTGTAESCCDKSFSKKTEVVKGIKEMSV